MLAGVPEVARGEQCPDGMVSVGAYCIDAFEATLWTSGGELHPFYRVPGEGKYRAESRRGLYPQGHIGRDVAEAACRNSGKRLCTSAEWERACRGPSPSDFPYGARWRMGQCNDRGVSAMGVLFGAGMLFTDDAMNDGRLLRVPGTVARTGEYGRCTNGYGVFDMVGNLHEWVSDPTGVLRGGYFLDTEKLGVGCGYGAHGHAPSYRDYSTGFRCCTDGG